jgi:guanosine-3',5'-bis(diphosphate) 3'-pyrophosphohydrolase
MKKTEILQKMLLLMVTNHDGQFDKGGRPYALHPLKVMHYLKSDDDELNCIALGHDIVEDTDITFEKLYSMGFPERVIAGIRAMTKIKGETYEEYKAKVMSNPDAVKVKMQDLRHNSDIRRLKGVTEKDIKRIEKYHQFYMELKELT